MVITVSAEEGVLLQRLLERELQNLRVRVHHTHDSEMRGSLKNSERVVRRLLERIEDAGRVLETRVIV
jgi:hypothetical protein